MFIRYQSSAHKVWLTEISIVSKNEQIKIYKI